MNTSATLNKKITIKARCTAKSCAIKNRITLVITVLFAASALAFPNTVRTSVISALGMCATTLIPSLFPFMISGELFFMLGGHRLFEKIMGKPFERIFGISGAGAGAFLLGAVCGLPLGGKYAISLYKNGDITKDDCEHLMGLCNNAGMGFTVMGIGYSMWNNITFGWLLYGCEIFSAILCAILLSPKKQIDQKNHSIAPLTPQTEKKSFSEMLTEAVSSSAINMLKLCAFVVFFAAVSSFIKEACLHFNLPPLFFVTLSAFTEITFAASEARAFFLNGSISALHGAKTLTFFAVGFAGLSAHMQTASFALTEGVDMKKYYLYKLLCGLICALTGAIVLHYFNF